ncbi:LD-carboxypeptidase [Altericroceibacterium endophyticum]|uniref:LD-carboxypeptidase n=1 Tax=Altericroceibacterium endophyticum TaxID=1808508 RepID=A0A6I4T3R1_9SPHN|nr:LD-carboxypeptidase [Altericroceibacterium endophyticum]MXO64713.1 LD-carboxypeptidase [Altericroceibacterium endophyticum]
MTSIAICAPATSLTRERARETAALAAAEFPDVTLHFHEQCFLSDGHFAGSDSARLEAFVECANDPAMDALWFARGGYGGNRIAEQAISRLGDAAKKKVFLGYSDSGYLLAALYRAGVGRPVHGPMVVDGSRERGEGAIRRALAFLSGDMSGLEPSLDGQPAAAFNLITLAMLSGTDLMPDLAGHVVMLEEVSEHLYAVDRLFFHVTQNLRDCAGIRLGRISAVPENDRDFGQTAEEIAQYWCERNDLPYLGRADIGHDADNKIVPFGLAQGASRP